MEENLSINAAAIVVRNIDNAGSTNYCVIKPSKLSALMGTELVHISLYRVWAPLFQLGLCKLPIFLKELLLWNSSSGQKQRKERHRISFRLLVVCMCLFTITFIILNVGTEFEQQFGSKMFLVFMFQDKILCSNIQGDLKVGIQLHIHNWLYPVISKVKCLDIYPGYFLKI